MSLECFFSILAYCRKCMSVGYLEVECNIDSVECNKYFLATFSEEAGCTISSMIDNGFDHVKEIAVYCNVEKTKGDYSCNDIATDMKTFIANYTSQALPIRMKLYLEDSIELDIE